MERAAPSGVTRRQFLVGGAAGAAVLWAAPRVGWSDRASALGMDSPDPVDPSDSGDQTDETDSSGQLFSDNFNQEFPGFLLTNWNVVRPVLLVGMTQFGVPSPANSGLDSTGFLAGHGLAVCMSSPSNGPGRIESGEAFTFPEGKYTLSFQVAGSHHSADSLPATLIASVPDCGAAMTVIRSASDGFLRYSLDFSVDQATVSTVVFESGDAPGQSGLILDDVALTVATSS
jgi:hypothetical protein